MLATFIAYRSSAAYDIDACWFPFYDNLTDDWSPFDSRILPPTVRFVRSAEGLLTIGRRPSRFTAGRWPTDRRRVYLRAVWCSEEERMGMIHWCCTCNRLRGKCAGVVGGEQGLPPAIAWCIERDEKTSGASANWATWSAGTCAELGL